MNPKSHPTPLRRNRARTRRAMLLLAYAGLFTAAAAGAPVVRNERLEFTINEGRIQNHFFRQGAVAAHILASSGTQQRLIVAFPAGNAGAAIWFEPTASDQAFTLRPGTTVEPVERPDGMRGVRAHFTTTASELRVQSAVLGNIRMIRDCAATPSKQPPASFAARVSDGPNVIWQRATVDGRHHVELALTGEDGTRVTADAGAVRVESAPGRRLAFTVMALADDAPLTPFAPGRLFTSAVADRPRDQQVFSFLAFEEKLAAGSWRFLTYFGRNTLLTTQLMMTVLQPEVIEAALGSVIERLSPSGEVAHEEGIGEFAVIENQKAGRSGPALFDPILDYKMVDSSFLLAPAVAGYLLDTPSGSTRAKAFLARSTSHGESYAAALRRNFELVLRETAAFAREPSVAHLIALKPGIAVGNWRDSQNGLGGGRYPFDINVALAPAALRAIGRLYETDFVGADPALAVRASAAAERWNMAERFFQVDVAADTARENVTAYARSVGLEPADALASIQGPVRYDAIALHEDGSPVPVMHTDSGFVLFFGHPAPAYLDTVADELMRPFPAGLRLPVGLPVSNPVFGGPTVWAQFTRGDYHGTSIWSWQQALMAAGLRRQLARTDLPVATRQRCEAAQKSLWQLIRAMQQQSSGELWTWEPRDGVARYAPFGQVSGHVDESNAAQLWSTVYLAVQPP